MAAAHREMPVRVRRMSLLLAMLIAAIVSLPLLAGVKAVVLENWLLRIGDISYQSRALPWNYPRGRGGAGADHRGYGLYSTEVVIDGACRGSQLAVYFRGADDADVTRVNGVRIGSTGRFPDNESTGEGFVSAWRLPRVYPLPESIIRFDAANRIEVNVYSPSGQGGMIGASAVIAPFDEAQRMAEGVEALNNIPRVAAIALFFIATLFLLKKCMQRLKSPLFKEMFKALFNSVNPVHFVRRYLHNNGEGESYLVRSLAHYLATALSLLCFSLFMVHELTYDTGIIGELSQFTSPGSVFLLYLGILFILPQIHAKAFRPATNEAPAAYTILSVLAGVLTHPFAFVVYVAPVLVLPRFQRFEDFTIRGCFIVGAMLTVLLVKSAIRCVRELLYPARRSRADILLSYTDNLVFLAGCVLSIAVFAAAPAALHAHALPIASIFIAHYTLDMIRTAENEIVLYRQLGAEAAPSETKSGAVSARIQEVIAFIDKNYAEDLTRDNIACAIHLSPEHLSRIFNAAMRMSLVEYLSKVRVSAAATLLAGTDRTVINIAYTTGFNSLRTFNRAFLKYTGLTPSNYRAQLRQRDAQAGSVIDE